jgi:hypothetical protein
VPSVPRLAPLGLERTITIRLVNDEPITTTPKEGDQRALWWLGVWFDRKLTFKRHVDERAAKGIEVA